MLNAMSAHKARLNPKATIMRFVLASNNKTESDALCVVGYNADYSMGSPVALVAQDYHIAGDDHG
jgi:hypothetical protein